MRIGLFTNNYLPLLGGVSSAVETTRRAVAGLGHRVWVIAPAAPGLPGVGDYVVPVPAIPAPTYPEFRLPCPVALPWRERLRALALDVYHAQHPFLLGGTARRLARQARRPLVFTYHTRYEKYAHYALLPERLGARLALAWSTWFANQADLVIAPSAALAQRLRGLGVRSPVEVLPTGVDLDRFRPGDSGVARARLGLAPDRPLLLYVGRLDREKNLDLLLDTFARLARRHPRAELLLVGRGTRVGRLRARAGALGVGSRVRFLGGVAPTDLPTYYQAADLFVFASTTETQGLAVLEAMACGVPVVAVRAPGTEEVVADGVSGLLVPEDPEAFAAAVEGLLGDRDLAAKLGAGGREGAAAYAAPTLARRLVSLYAALGGS